MGLLPLGQLQQEVVLLAAAQHSHAAVHEVGLRERAVGAGVTHADVEKCIRKAAPPELTAVTLFDIFKSKDIGNDRRSFAYSLAFRSPSRTLTDDEVNGAFAKIVDALKATLQVEVRDS